MSQTRVTQQYEEEGNTEIRRQWNVGATTYTHNYGVKIHRSNTFPPYR